MAILRFYRVPLVVAIWVLHGLRLGYDKVYFRVVEGLRKRYYKGLGFRFDPSKVGPARVAVIRDSEVSEYRSTLFSLGVRTRKILLLGILH